MVPCLSHRKRCFASGCFRLIRRIQLNSKFQSRIQELEKDLEAEQMAHGEAVKTSRRHERKLKELQFSTEEDSKALTRQEEQISKLISQNKLLRKQLEETVSIGI